MSSKTASPSVGEVPAGGLWERQRTYGGLRMQQEFAAEEQFILWGITSGGELVLEKAEKPVSKTILTVSRMDSPEERKEVGTLSGPIAAMVPDANPDDFPVVAFWTTVPTDQPSDAVVLNAVGRYEG